jgi:hypothetical protein
MITSDEFPREIIFKTVFRTGSCAKDSITGCLKDKGVIHSITEKKSENGNFTSFTVTAFYETEEILHDVCSHVKSVEGFMMML